jgi:uncharacterized protein DUF4197
MIQALIIIALLLTSIHPAWAQLDKVLKGLGGAVGGGSGLSDAKIGSGLQEALKVGTESAVVQTGRVDGFLLNKAIKILMPKPLQAMEQPLRLVGYGPQIDEFVVGMNRAAEKAVPFAKDIFWEAIGQMTFDDATKILNGGDTAATDYFKAKTSEETADRLPAECRRCHEPSGGQPAIQRVDRAVQKRALCQERDF